MIRTIVSWGLYWGDPVLWNYHVFLGILQHFNALMDGSGQGLPFRLSSLLIVTCHMFLVCVLLGDCQKFDSPRHQQA